MNKIIKDIIPFLNKMDGVYFELVSAMIEPVFDEEIGTACVDFAPNDLKKNIGFRINQKFWESLNYHEKCFVFVHEVFHVMFSHAKRGIEYMESLPEEQKNMKILNISEDICINEILLKYFFNSVPISAMPTIKDTMCTIESVFGDNKVEKEKSFGYYYQKILEYDIVAESFDSQILPSGEGEAEEMDEQIQEIAGQVEEESFHTEQGYGYSTSKETGSSEQSIRADKAEENIENLIKISVASSRNKSKPKRKTKWYGINRRTSFVNSQSDLIMPIYKDVENKRKHNVVCYCDYSGSCVDETQKFIGIVEKLNRKKYDIRVHFFASKVSKSFAVGDEYNFNSIGGGTDIEEVLEHFDRQYNNNIDAVFVLTDGYYRKISNIKNAKYKKWYFFIFDAGFSANSSFLNSAPYHAKIHQI